MKILPMVILMFLLVGCSAVDKHTETMISMVDSENYADLNEKIKKIEEDDSLSEEEVIKISEGVLKKLASNLDSLVAQFKNEDIELVDFQHKLDDYNSIKLDSVSTKIKGVRTELKELIESRGSFSSALDYYTDKDYTNSLNEFLKVIEKDNKYKQSQNYIAEIKPLLLKEIENAANKEKNNKHFKDAYIAIKEKEKYLADNTEYKALLDNYSNLYYEDSINKVKKLRDNKKFDIAIEELRALNKNIGFSNEITVFVNIVVAFPYFSIIIDLLNTQVQSKLPRFACWPGYLNRKEKRFSI